jgi:hypothetical protein
MSLMCRGKKGELRCYFWTNLTVIPSQFRGAPDKLLSSILLERKLQVAFSIMICLPVFIESGRCQQLERMYDKYA